MQECGKAPQIQDCYTFSTDPHLEWVNSLFLPFFLVFYGIIAHFCKAIKDWQMKQTVTLR